MTKHYFLIAIVLFFSGAAAAQSARDDLFVSPDWLAAHITDKDLVILHLGEDADYSANHIPGAQYVSIDHLSVSRTAPGALTLEMLPPDVLRRRLEELGISDRSHVVVYFAGDWVTDATRTIFTLNVAGLHNVSLLDGGLDAWKRAGHATTGNIGHPSRGSMQAFNILPLIVDAAFVRAHIRSAGYDIVDARAKVYYDGLQVTGSASQPRERGHIPSAKSIPFESVLSSELKFKSTAELADIFKRAGVNAHDRIIVYCHVGQQATAVILAARSLGVDAVLYDGSFEDWSKRGFPTEQVTERASQ